jgi:hypothetical protein
VAFLSPRHFDVLQKSITDSMIRNYSAASVDKATLFLSHSRKDAQYLDYAKKFFATFEASVYVDIGDDRLPTTPSPQTAAILKDMIKKCPRFVVLVSADSKDSKWVPWELGLADGFKGTTPVALLPFSLTGNDEDWAKQEYLGLYPRIHGGTLPGYTNAEWLVHDPTSGKNWRLREWLHQRV